MRRLIALVSLLLLVFCCVPTSAAQADTQDTPKLRVLITIGGHGFDRKSFFAMFDLMPDVEYQVIELPKQADILRPGLEKKFDCIVMYDMSAGMNAKQREAFVELLNRGIGLVSLHHNLGAHRNWDEFRKIIGGKFIFEDTVIDGTKYSKTPWSHGEHLKVHVADPNHPITQGLKDFEVEDETYGRYYVADGVHVLLTTDHPKNNPVIAWVKRYGNSRVFYLQLGHDAGAYNNPNYRKLVYQGIRWAAQK